MEYGIWNSIDDVSVISILSSRYDFIVIDLEHGYRSFDRIQTAILLLAAQKKDFMVRVRSTQDPLIQTLLDLGVKKFVLPKSKTLDEVRIFESQLLFPPNGTRGNHPKIKFGFQNFGIKKSFTEYNNEIHLCVIVETKELLAQIQSIHKISSVKELYLGAYDLSLDLQLVEGINDDGLKTIYSKIADVCDKNSLVFSSMVSEKFLESDLKNYGVTKMICGIDISFLEQSLQRF
jgi:2-keto-3-deoxy-L-rhamnonate aldolase RhmA